jgi:hypothetical protein
MKNILYALVAVSFCCSYASQDIDWSTYSSGITPIPETVNIPVAPPEKQGWFSRFPEPPVPTAAEIARRNRVYDYTQAYTPKQTGYWASFQNWLNQKRGITPRQVAREARQADYAAAYSPKQPRYTSRRDELTKAYLKNAEQDYLYALRERERAQEIARDAAFEVEKMQGYPLMFYSPKKTEEQEAKYRNAVEDWKIKKQRLDNLEKKERSKARKLEPYYPWYTR